MTLLREIQDEAMNSSGNLSNLLRKCKVLAARLGNEEFRRWVDLELSGYGSVEELPVYRIVRSQCKGHFVGAFESGMDYAEIPLINIPEEHHKFLSNSYLKEPIAEIENLASGTNNPQEPLPPEFLMLFGDKIFNNMSCIQAWKMIPRNQLVAALDEVKNRILNFVLEIESLDPAAGDGEINSKPVPDEKVHQVFHTNIFGAVQNMATGSHQFEQTAVVNETNSEVFQEILEALHELKNPNITVPIANAIEEMQASQGTEKFKDHYKNFMSLLSDHMQVLGPVVIPYLPALAAMIS